jgi:hypothetical protein
MRQLRNVAEQISETNRDITTTTLQSYFKFKAATYQSLKIKKSKNDFSTEILYKVLLT